MAQKKQLNLSRLPPDQKRAAWEYLKANSPEAVEWIQSEFVQAVVATFDAEIVIEDPRNEEKKEAAAERTRLQRIQFGKHA